MRKSLLARAAIIALCFTGIVTQSSFAIAQTEIKAKNYAIDLKAHDVAADRSKEAPFSLNIAKLNADIKIIGQTAETTIYIDFANDSPRTLEGDLSIQLPKVAYVIGFGLDINGVMFDGVLENKQKAKTAYEENLRRGSDPALGTIDETNKFTTKVFPIFPKIGRKIKITYVTPLDATGNYELPLLTDKPIGDLKIKLRHDRGNNILINPPVGLINLNNEYSAQNKLIDGAFKLSAKPIEGINITEHRNGDSYFELILKANNKEVPKPKNIQIYWDSSLSHKVADTQKEAALLAEYINFNNPEAVDLILFSDNKPIIKRLNNPSGQDFINAITNVNYEGATSFEYLQKQSGSDVCLLVSDGRFNLSAVKREKWGCRVFAISASQTLKRDFLEVLTNYNNGGLIDLNNISNSNALKILNSKPPSFKSLSANGKKLEYISNYLGDDFYQIIGPKPDAEHISIDLGDKIIAAAIPKNAQNHNGAGTFWGANEIAANQGEDIDLVRKYNIASEKYSFIVLETARDYAINKITPTMNAPKELQRQYATLKLQLEKEFESEKQDRFETIEDMWKDRKEWWNTKFTLPKKPIKPTQDKRVNPPQMVSVPPPPMAEVAAPVASPRMEAESANAEAVIVTGTRAAPNNRNNTVTDNITAEDIGAMPDRSVAESMQRIPGVSIDRAPANSQSSNMKIVTADFNPDRPYIKALSGVKNGDYDGFEKIYTTQQQEYGKTPAFYFDMAEWAFKHGIEKRAARIAHNAIELMNTSLDTQIILAGRLLKYKDFDNAIYLYEEIAKLNDVPQSKRNLALALRARAINENKADAIKDYKRAVNLLSEVVLGVWNDDYDGIEIIALMEANEIILKLKNLGVSEREINTLLDKRLIDNLAVDIRVVLEWNTDKTDMDLWVKEPTGETAIYSHPKTVIGGTLSNDMTRGYGPEEYLLKNAPKGIYKILANAYAGDRLDPNGPSSLIVNLYKDWGKPTQSVEIIVVELAKDKEGTVNIGSFKKE